MYCTFAQKSITLKTNYIESNISEEKELLKDHKLYQTIKSIDDIKIFMESHVFAVWDFMSLVKALQIKLTCINLPWIPPKNTNLSRFINEIVFSEESDINEKGEAKSHFEMYHEAMKAIGASTENIDYFLDTLQTTNSLEIPLERITKDTLQNKAVIEFVRFSFDIINRNKAHEIAAIFTFGREDLIPEMFLKILKNTENKHEEKYTKINYYLQRHIEIDGDHHGPIALKMVSELCGDDPVKWEEAKNASKKALQKRIALWDEIHTNCINKKSLICH